jgi:hypothetical protein
MDHHTKESLSYTLAFLEGNDICTRIMGCEACVEVLVSLSGAFAWALRALLITSKEALKIEEQEPKIHGCYPQGVVGTISIQRGVRKGCWDLDVR